VKDTTEQVAFRLPVGLLKNLDRFADKKRLETGIAYTRTDAVRHLLTVGLRREGYRDGNEAKSKRT